MPVGPIDDVAIQGEVLAVTGSAVWVLHSPISASVDSAEPAKHSIIRGGREFAGSPWSPSHVEWVGHHELTPVEVGTQHKGDPFHPIDHCPCFRSHLDQG